MENGEEKCLEGRGLYEKGFENEEGWEQKV